MTKLQKYDLVILSVMMILLSGASATWAGKSTNSISEKDMNIVKDNSAEAISAVEFDGEKIKLGVLSFGCTSANDFEVRQIDSDNSCSITIVRTKPDLCRRAPFVANIEIEWSLPKECTDLALHINNPVLVTQAKGGVVKRMK